MSEDGARSALLCGRDHTGLGEIAAVAEGPAAITLSRGGAAKRYSYTHPNEDAALFVLGGAAALIAVADGHWGNRGSQLVLEAVQQRGQRWIQADAPGDDERVWESEALALLHELNVLLRDDAARRRIDPAPTTLSLALQPPGSSFLCCARVGDSHLFRVGDEGVAELGTAGRHFLGDRDLDLEAVREIAWIGREPRSGVRAIVLATDGLSESGIGVDDPCAAVGAAVARAEASDAPLRALETTRTLTEVGLAAQRKKRAGDNLACATLWLEEDESLSKEP